MYKAYITRIKNLRKHSNADRLQIGECFGNSVIVDLKTQENELGVYFPTDGQLGIEYATENNLLRTKDENGNNTGGYLDPNKRNIVAIKLRGEKSDGLFMPLISLNKFTDIALLKEGETIDILDGVVICQKYIPKRSGGGNSSGSSKKSKTLENLYPQFEEHIDTGQLEYNLNNFKENDLCYMSLKLHGTSQRTAYTLKEQTKKTFSNWIKSKLRIGKPTITYSYNYVSGTRRRVLEEYQGFYGSELYRKNYHDFFVGKLNKGEEVFYEVVGYTDTGKLIMGECNNKKTNDKEFIKKYGATTKFTYGCNSNESQIYVYRMTITNPDGYVVDYPTELVKQRCEEMGVNFVPILDKFLFSSKDDLLDRAKAFSYGSDLIDPSHIREGVVVRIDNRKKFTAFKYKSFEFKVLEGIIKAEATEPDIEEGEEISCDKE